MVVRFFLLLSTEARPMDCNAMRCNSWLSVPSVTSASESETWHLELGAPLVDALPEVLDLGVPFQTLRKVNHLLPVLILHLQADLDTLVEELSHLAAHKIHNASTQRKREKRRRGISFPYFFPSFSHFYRHLSGLFTS
mmetsp:Transcript_10216/g.25519  ORF Transcript_10216/g.25519 Transcript_10216/m.25519 type:complete len:138 (+) Transcript_10216:92-505(+)